MKTRQILLNKLQEGIYRKDMTTAEIGMLHMLKQKHDIEAITLYSKGYTTPMFYRLKPVIYVKTLDQQREEFRRTKGLERAASDIDKVNQQLGEAYLDSCGAAGYICLLGEEELPNRGRVPLAKPSLLQRFCNFMFGER